MKNTLKKLLSLQKESDSKKFSYSQCGEDLIVEFLFQTIGIEKPSYMDIGAHHPYYLSNTALFYSSGSTGINVEPDPSLFPSFIKERKRDINLNVGISDSESELDFYLFNVPTLNTFSKEAASEYEKEGNFFVKEIKKIKVQTIQHILGEYANNAFPDFLSLDAEGIDKLIINSIDLKNNFPKVICIETLSFSDSGNGVKDVELIKLIESNDYFLYGDTHINSIFVKNEYWKK